MNTPMLTPSPFSASELVCKNSTTPCSFWAQTILHTKNNISNCLIGAFVMICFFFCFGISSLGRNPNPFDVQVLARNAASRWMVDQRHRDEGLNRIKKLPHPLNPWPMHALYEEYCIGIGFWLLCIIHHPISPNANGDYVAAATNPLPLLRILLDWTTFSALNHHLNLLPNSGNWSPYYRHLHRHFHN